MKQFKAGKYFIGDISSVISGNQNKVFYQEVKTNCDQCYDNIGGVYYLMSKVLGIAPIDLFKCDTQQLNDFGVVYNFKQDFQAYQQEGAYHFGHILININQCQCYDDLDLYDQQY